MTNFLLQYGNTLPSNAINLAWISPPPLTPLQNIGVIDVIGKNPVNTSELSKELLSVKGYTCKYNEVLAANIPSDTYIAYLQSPIQVVNSVEDETGAWHARVSDGVIRIQTEYVKPLAWESDTLYYKGDRIRYEGCIHTCTTTAMYSIATDDNSPSGAGSVWKTTSWQSSWLDDTAMDEGWDTDTQIVLIYTLPELHQECYSTQYIDNSSIFNMNEWGIRGKTSNEEYAVFLDEHTVAVSNKNIYAITSIIINDKVIVSSETLTNAITQNNISNFSCIKSIDFTNGIIILTSSITPADAIQITYKYSALDLTYRGYYDDILERYCDLDLNPSSGHTYDNGKPSKNLLSSVVYLYLLPSAVYNYEEAQAGDVKYFSADRNNSSPQLLRWESGPSITLPSSGSEGDVPDVVVGGSAKRSRYGEAYYGLNEFMLKGIADTPQIVTEDGMPGDGLHAGGVGSLKGQPHALILAKLFVSPNGIIDTVNLIDTRIKGGGVKEKVNLSALNGDEIAEMGTYWDIGGWEGELTMLNGVVVIELPESLLAPTNNGSPAFTEKEIEDIVSKHVAAGIKPIIRYVPSSS